MLKDKESESFIKDSEIREIRSEVEKLSYHIEQNNQKDSRVLIAISSVSSVVITLFLGIQIYNSFSLNDGLDRIEQRSYVLMEKTEKRIDTLIGSLSPDRATVTNIDPSDSHKLIASTTISRKKIDSGEFFQLKFYVPAKINVEGESVGRLLGFEYRFSEEFANLFYSLVV